MHGRDARVCKVEEERKPAKIRDEIEPLRNAPIPLFPRSPFRDEIEKFFFLVAEDGQVAAFEPEVEAAIGLWSFAHHIARRYHDIAVARRDGIEQPPQLVVAAVDVADKDMAHNVIVSWWTPRFSGRFARRARRPFHSKA